LFRRPVFFDELRRAGVRDMPVSKQVAVEERQEARKYLQRANIKIIEVNLAYFTDDPELVPMFEELLSVALCDLLSFSNLVRDTKQTKLDLAPSKS
jgi:hypothetical protein